MNNYTEPPFSGSFSGLSSSLKYLDVPPDSVKLKFLFFQFYPDIFTLFRSFVFNKIQ